MGNGTSRLYSALTKTLDGSPAAQHPEYLVAPDPEQLEPIDPKELLEECRAVLHTRPPRFQRGFVDLRADGPSSSHAPIRVMQWNILAQGTPACAVTAFPAACPAACAQGEGRPAGGAPARGGQEGESPGFHGPVQQLGKYSLPSTCADFPCSGKVSASRHMLPVSCQPISFHQLSPALSPQH